MVTFVYQRKLISIVKALRPRQWIKNFAIFAGLVFSGSLDDRSATIVAAEAFFLFCIASSATYLLNDVFDIDRDRLHPFKIKRPIASGEVSIPLAVTLSLVFIMIVLPLSFKISPAFFIATLSYLLLQLFYSVFLKSVILVDVITIATGFVLRVYAGIWAIGAHLNVWFLLCVISFALFLAIGKRRSELTLLQSQAAKHRETLLHYPESLLDILTSMFANSTWLAYALFTFNQPPIAARPRISLLLESFSLPFAHARFLMVTVPVVIYGVMRYLYIIYEKKEGESPERVLLTDSPLLTAVMLWLALTLGIIYYLGT